MLLRDVEVKRKNAVGEHLQVFFLEHVQIVEEMELELDMLIGLLFALEQSVDVVD